MEGSFSAAKRADESPSSTSYAESIHPFPYSTAPSSKRRNVPSGTPLKLSANWDTIFRLLCPMDKTRTVIGKGGTVIRLIQEETGARVCIEDPVPGSDDRIVRVMADSILRRRREGIVKGDEEPSPALSALVRVFERIARGEEGEGAEMEIQKNFSCRLLVQSCHVGCVLGRGGKMVEKIRSESGAQVRVFANELVPPCADAEDELIQISGTFLAVRKALLSVARCLLDNNNIKADQTTFSAAKPYMETLQGHAPRVPLDIFPQREYSLGPHGPYYHHGTYASNQPLDNIPSDPRKNLEEVSFRLLCANDKVGIIIGKFGIILRSLQNESGATVKILDATAHSEDRIILISAFESYESKHSQTQDAVLQVHCRLAEACSDRGSVSARLLVPAQRIGCLLGKGGSIIAEMRRATGASIKIFAREQVPKCAQPNEGLVQVNGTFQSVKEALLHITSRIRETFFLQKLYPDIGMPRQLPVMPEMMPPCMTRNDGPPIRYPTIAISSPHDIDPSARTSKKISATSPKFMIPQKNGNPKGVSVGSSTQLPSKTVTVAVPEAYMGFVHGENDSNLALIREVSGANVVVYDPKRVTREGTIVISGNEKQTSTAQGLLHAFILNGL